MLLNRKFILSAIRLNLNNSFKFSQLGNQPITFENMIVIKEKNTMPKRKKVK